MDRRNVFLPLLFFMLVSLSGCGDILYLTKLGWHQGFISHQSVPIEEILNDDRVASNVKEKILFIQEVKRYGEENLGLRKTSSYSSFFEVKGPILYVITACEKDRLELFSWNFPLVGRMTYRGFFTKEDALDERRSLEAKEFDTFVQPVAAYSTLGWMQDPIFSSMMKMSRAALANLILHEMTHATIYVKGNTDFNEQVATFVGNRGAIAFLTERDGPMSKEVLEAIHFQEDDLIFSEWVAQACGRLSHLYNREISRQEKISEREEIFRRLREDFRDVKSQFKTKTYEDFDKIKLNNAVLLAHRRYIRRLDKFEALYEGLGKDLKKVIAFFKAIQASGKDPSAFLERSTAREGTSAPSSL
jgi:predicted aminopeptidase